MNFDSRIKKFHRQSDFLWNFILVVIVFVFIVALASMSGLAYLATQYSAHDYGQKIGEFMKGIEDGKK